MPTDIDAPSAVNIEHILARVDDLSVIARAALTPGAPPVDAPALVATTRALFAHALAGSAASTAQEAHSSASAAGTLSELDRVVFNWISSWMSEEEKESLQWDEVTFEHALQKWKR